MARGKSFVSLEGVSPQTFVVDPHDCDPNELVDMAVQIFRDAGCVDAFKCKSRFDVQTYLMNDALRCPTSRKRV